MSSKPSSGTILLVDDEALVRKSASAMLKTSGFAFIEAVDGQDAVLKYQEFHDQITLVLMDIAMPKLSGIQAARQIKNIDYFAKIILMSGSSFQPPSDEVADAFLIKPLRGRDLLNAVHRVLGEKKLQIPYGAGR